MGKTSVAEVIGDLLRQARVPHAVIDMDWLSNAWPAPIGDRFNDTLALRNLESISANYFDAGILRLVLAGVMETRANRDRYHRALGVPMAVCRLKVDLSIVRARLARRHVGGDAVLRWHLRRSGELNAISDEASLEDSCVDATGVTLLEAADQVLQAVGWAEVPAPAD